MSELEERINNILSSPDELSRIIDIAKSVSESMGGEKKSKNIGFDIAGLINSTKSDGKGELLSAMLPFVRDVRRNDMEKAIKLLSLIKVAKVFLNKEGGEDV